jgi:hypothetical protein
MLNNCKDHSKGKKCTLNISVNHENVTCAILDNGIGVLTSLNSVLALDEPREIIFELSKGKLTSDSSNHTGEGIFFTSRAFDCFTLTTNSYIYMRNNFLQDWTLQKTTKTKGALVELELNINTTRKLKSLFDHYTNDEHDFSTTEILVDLATQYGERLISRSQAKRVIKNLDKFSKVVLNFKHVATVGQGFVDQLFRVYQHQQPGTEISYINANEDVTFMIKRGSKALI